MTRARWWRLAGLLALVVALVALAVGVAEARPGGGHTFSGGGSSGGGGGGGDDSGLIHLLIWLCIEHPHVGLPILVIVIIGYILQHRKNSELKDWDSAAGVARTPTPQARPEQLQTLDPEFSQVLFDDFLFRLYAQAQQARSSAEAMAALAPYLAPRVRDALVAREPAGQPITNVVVGEMNVESISVPPSPMNPDTGEPNFVRVTVFFGSNITAGAPGAQQTYYMLERWVLERAADVQSKPPDPTRRFPCPNCGAPFQSSDEQTCEYCGEVVANGRFDWLVSGCNLVGLTQVPPAFSGTVAERGTDRPTITDPRVDEMVAADPALTQATFGARLSMIYHELNRGWTALDLSIVRPYVSDGLYDYLQYWIDAYKNQGLRNMLEEMQLHHWTYAKLRRDKHYHALTVRIWGVGRDYTVNNEGKVVGGSKRSQRHYSEYWTLIRSAAASGAARADKQCPNCGAPMEITMAGTCTHCDVHVTAGEFDWVLSKIEQDEVYRG